MVRGAVKVVIRTRPTDRFTDSIVLGDDNRNVTVHLNKRKRKDEVVNNQQNVLGFKFDGVLHNYSQDAVFAAVGRDVVQSVLDGFNGTLLAYGQTGAGKTYTMSGGSDFKQRGLIPRCIAQVFNDILNKPERSYEVRVGFLEVYNEHLYDLLADPGAEPRELAIQEDSRGNISVRGLTMKNTAQEADALSLFFEGSANRAIAEHQLNANSTRSHCVFTIFVSSRSRVESDGNTTFSKLNCVDLAGSERVSKTGSEGQILKEALYINKSLSFLEQVVIALSTSGRDHVPYRQSKLTNLLKDSLGGNCKTTMVANIWGEEQHLEETVSTLKFATRMMHVQNDASVNVMIDPEAQIRRMAKEIAELKSELQMQNQLHGKSHVTYGEEFTDDERFALQKEVRNYLEGKSDIEFKTIRQVREMFRVFKMIVENTEAEVTARLQQRFTLQEKQGSLALPKGPASQRAADDGLGEEDYSSGFGLGTAPAAKAEKAAPKDKHQRASVSAVVAAPPPPPPVTVPDRNEAFEEFKITAGAELADIMRQNQQSVKEKKTRIRDLGNAVNQWKVAIEKLRFEVESRRQDRDEAEGDIVDEEEFAALRGLKNAKQQYRNAYEELQRVKAERDYEARLIDQARSKLLLDFADWFERTYGVPAALDPNGAFPKRPIARPSSVGSLTQGGETEDVDPESTAFYAARKAAATVQKRKR